MKNPLQKIISLFEKKTVADLVWRHENKINKRSERYLKAEIWLYKKCLSLLISSIRLSRTALEEAGDRKLLFHEAFVRLSVKIFHNAEAMRHLINKGLYGSCFVLKRTLVFDVHMIWYLYFNPDLIEPWLSEKFVTYQDRKWRDKFKEQTIIKNLEAKGKEYNLKLTDTEFTFYSKAGHPCFFSIRFFQNKNGVLAYIPDFQFETAQWMLWSVVGLLLYPTQVYLLQHKDHETDDLKALRNEYNQLMETANHFGLKVVETHKDVYNARPLEEIRAT